MTDTEPTPQEENIQVNLTYDELNMIILALEYSYGQIKQQMDKLPLLHLKNENTRIYERLLEKIK